MGTVYHVVATRLPDYALNWACIGCVLSVTMDEGTEVLPGTEVSLAVRKD